MTGFDRMREQLLRAFRVHLANPRVRPDVPEAGKILWEAFIDLDASRAFHANGACPITFLEIEAWCRLKRYPLEPRHVDVLRAMDSVLIRHLADVRKQELAKRKMKLTPKLFDANWR